MKEFLLAAWYNNPGVITGAVFGALFTAIAVGSAFTAAFKSNPVSAETVSGGRNSNGTGLSRQRKNGRECNSPLYR